MKFVQIPTTAAQASESFLAFDNSRPVFHGQRAVVLSACVACLFFVKQPEDAVIVGLAQCMILQQLFKIGLQELAHRLNSPALSVVEALIHVAFDVQMVHLVWQQRDSAWISYAICALMAVVMLAGSYRSDQKRAARLDIQRVEAMSFFFVNSLVAAAFILQGHHLLFAGISLVGIVATVVARTPDRVWPIPIFLSILSPLVPHYPKIFLANLAYQFSVCVCVTLAFNLAWNFRRPSPLPHGMKLRIRYDDLFGTFTTVAEHSFIFALMWPRMRWEMSLTSHVTCFLVGIFFFGNLFYIAHRFFMHRNPFFMQFHDYHHGHDSIDSSAFTSSSFHPMEAPWVPLGFVVANLLGFNSGYAFVCGWIWVSMNNAMAHDPRAPGLVFFDHWKHHVKGDRMFGVGPVALDFCDTLFKTNT